MEPVRPVVGPSALARAGARTGTRGGTPGFSVGPGAPSAASASRAEAAAELLGLIAVQEQDEGERRDRGAHKRCREMLRALTELQRALLGSALDTGVLDHLATLSRAPIDAANPDLALLNRMIAVRARVELARAEAMGNLKIARQDRETADYHLGAKDGRGYKPPP